MGHTGQSAPDYLPIRPQPVDGYYWALEAEPTGTRRWVAHELLETVSVGERPSPELTPRPPLVSPVQSLGHRAVRAFAAAMVGFDALVERGVATAERSTDRAVRTAKRLARLSDEQADQPALAQPSGVAADAFEAAFAAGEQAAVAHMIRARDIDWWAQTGVRGLFADFGRQPAGPAAGAAGAPNLLRVGVANLRDSLALLPEHPNYTDLGRYLGHTAALRPSLLFVSEAVPAGVPISPAVLDSMAARGYSGIVIANHDRDGRPDGHDDALFILGDPEGVRASAVDLAGRHGIGLTVPFHNTAVRGLFGHIFDRQHRPEGWTGQGRQRVRAKEQAAREVRAAQAAAVVQYLGGAACAIFGGDLNSQQCDTPAARVLRSGVARAVSERLPAADPGEPLPPQPVALPGAKGIWKKMSRAGSLLQRLVAMAEDPGRTDGFRQTLQRADLEPVNPAQPVTRPVVKWRLPFGLGKITSKPGMALDDIYVRGMEPAAAVVVPTGKLSDHDMVVADIRVPVPTGQVG